MPCVRRELITPRWLLGLCLVLALCAYSPALAAPSGKAGAAPKTTQTKAKAKTKVAPPKAQADDEDDDDDEDESPPSAPPSSPAPSTPSATPEGAPPADDGWESDSFIDQEDAPDPSTPAETIYNLERCLKITRDRNVLIKAAHWKVVYGQARGTEAQWAWFPRVMFKTFLAPAPNINQPNAQDFSAFMAQRGSEHWYNFDGVLWGADITISAPLFTFGKIYHVIKQGPLAEKAARLEEKKVRASVAYEVKRAFYSLQLLEQSADMLDEGQDNLKQAEDKLAELLAQGDTSVSKVDGWRLEVMRSEIMAKVEETKQNRLLLLRALHLLLDLPDQAPLVLEHRYLRAPQAPAFLSDESSEPFVLRMTESRPEFALLKVDREYKERERKRQWAYFFPDIALYARYNYTKASDIPDIKNPWLVDPFNTSGFSGYLGLQYDLNLPGIAARYLQAKAQAELSRANEKAQASLMTFEAEQAFRDWKSRSAQIDIAKKGGKAGHKWMVSRSLDYGMGLIETKDVVDGISNYFKSQF